jgi:hypothetical protein
MNLTLRRLVILILLQSFIYSFLTEWITAYIDNISVNFYLEILIFAFLFLPLSSLLLLKKINVKYVIQVRNVIPFAIIFLILPCLHVSILFKYDIFSRRIGTENIAIAYGNMNSIDKFVMKIYDLSQFIFIISSYYILKTNSKFNGRLLLKLVLIVNLIYLLIFTAFNGRSTFLILIITLLVIDGLFLSISKKTRNYFLTLSVFIFLIVSLIRYMPLIIINSGEIETSDIVKNEILYRVNCSKLFNEVYEKSKQKGLLLGKTMLNPLLSFQAMLGDEDSKEKIRNAETGSKQYILSEYLQKSNKDDCSCVVVDSYVNFGVTGIFLLLCIYISWIVLMLKLFKRKVLQSYHFCFILIIISSLLLYEVDGLSLIFGIIKYLPIFLLFFILNPFSLIKCKING